MFTKGQLFLCATPIGNLDDITLRLVKTIKDVDIIAAEDTKRTIKILNHLNIQKKLISYHEHNKAKMGPKIIEMINNGQKVALLSDAGYPAIADPGEELVALALENNIKVTPIPGANAALSALIASGIQTTPFFFIGFLPKTKKNREEKLLLWKDVKETIILYEAPHRIEKVLKEIESIWGNRQIALARELTKIHEEFFYGTISECLDWLSKKPPKGEITVVVEGRDKKAVYEEVHQRMPPLEKLVELLKKGENKKESIKKIAVEYNISRRSLYKQLVDFKNNTDFGG